MLCDAKWYEAFYSVVDSDFFFLFSVEHARSSVGIKLELFYSILQAEEQDEVGEESFSDEIMT